MMSGCAFNTPHGDIILQEQLSQLKTPRDVESQSILYHHRFDLFQILFQFIRDCLNIDRLSEMIVHAAF